VFSWLETNTLPDLKQSACEKDKIPRQSNEPSGESGTPAGKIPSQTWRTGITAHKTGDSTACSSLFVEPQIFNLSIPLAGFTRSLQLQPVEHLRRVEVDGVGEGQGEMAAGVELICRDGEPLRC
jgi:hypothetical protein